MILAGDIGGTSTRLAYFEESGGKLLNHAEHIFRSRDYRTLEEAVSKFMTEQNIRTSVACFGIAGPVKDGRSETPNLPWVIEDKALVRDLGIANVYLLNDLEANAWGLSQLGPDDYFEVAPGSGSVGGNKAVISAGTGLGKAGLYWDGVAHRPYACEGGHADFPPVNDLQIELLQFLRKKWDHVSLERVLAGPGLRNIYEFLRDTGKGKEESWLGDEMRAGDASAAISRNGLSGKSPLAEQALDLFVDIYGQAAGNTALEFMALGGLYVGGGIAPKILPKLQQRRFYDAFLAKGRLRSLLERLPLRIVLNDHTALLGAATVAMNHALGRAVAARG
jgi:glucokinase